jgi:hypothetical protein
VSSQIKAKFKNIFGSSSGTSGVVPHEKTRPKNLLTVPLSGPYFSCFEQYIEYRFVTLQYNATGLF